MAFDRGYLSHHMITDVEKMQAVLDEPYILLTDQRLMTADEVAAVLALVADSKRPLLVIAEEVSPAAVVSLLAWRDKGGAPVAAIHPPEYGNWRKSALEDLAILTGGRVIARDLGGSIANAQLRDLGRARQVRVASNQTVISAGAGDPELIAARRAQVARQYEVAPENIERDKILTADAAVEYGLVDQVITSAREAADEGRPAEPQPLPLAAPAGGDAEAICPATGERYRLTAGTLALID